MSDEHSLELLARVRDLAIAITDPLGTLSLGDDPTFRDARGRGADDCLRLLSRLVTDYHSSKSEADQVFDQLAGVSKQAVFTKALKAEEVPVRQGMPTVFVGHKKGQEVYGFGKPITGRSTSEFIVRVADAVVIASLQGNVQGMGWPATRQALWYAGFLLPMGKLEEARTEIAWEFAQAASRVRAKQDATQPAPAMALTKTEAAVLSIIKAQPKGEGIRAKGIIKELKRRCIQLAESSLRKHVLPKLVTRYGVINHRAAGGYLVP